ncbi:MAG: hypothetical protein JNL90_02635 [Planctomycetes bacterium]|nr:hypothetical protein [Planctomycetota bacterium]
MTTRSIASRGALGALLRDPVEAGDEERRLLARSSALSLFGLALGLLGRRRWLIVPLVVQGVVLHGALERRRPTALVRAAAPGMRRRR